MNGFVTAGRERPEEAILRPLTPRLATSVTSPVHRTVGLMISSGTETRGGRLTTNSTASATSSGFRIKARCSSVTGLGRAARIGVSISPG